MARFVRWQRREFDSRVALNRFLVTERTIALVHIPAAVCLAIAMLAEGNVLTLVAQRKWQLIFVSSTYFVVVNGRNAYVNMQRYLIPDKSNRRKTCKASQKGDHQRSRCQVQVLSALTMALASLSLLNSSLIGMSPGGGSTVELHLRQLALAFGLFLVGTACNNVAAYSVTGLNCTGILLGFQNVMGSAAYGATSLLLLLRPSLAKISGAYQLALALSAAAGGLVTTTSAVTHCLYTLDNTRRQVEHFRKHEHWNGENQKKCTDVLRQTYLSKLTDAICSTGNGLFWSNTACNEPAIGKGEFLSESNEGSVEALRKSLQLSRNRMSRSVSPPSCLSQSSGYLTLPE
eukprot:GFKZ01002799.1.p1 GENE.GFKZ01002799.1~~GFKZ01002799.1.p1  ORF type:complete len:346 (+),score=21.57 GFKZ01002799.1:126-1163(+)